MSKKHEDRLSRQQRRAQEREGKKVQNRQTFSKTEIQIAVLRAHKECRELTLQAVKEVLGLGSVRMGRIEQRLSALEDEAYNELFLHHLRNNKLI